MRARTTTGIRPFDVLLTAVLTGLGIWLMLLNITETRDVTARIDSHSWLLLPVWLAAVVPVLFWRRSPLVVAAISTLALAVHVVAFGWEVRCGAGLPLTWTIAFLVGTRDGWRRSLVGLGLAEVICCLVLVEDAAAGPGLIPVAGVMTAGIWGIGRLVHQRSGMTAELERRNAELAALRDARATLDVTSDRARLSAELDELLDVRLDQLSRTAESRTVDAEDTRAVLERLENDSRQVLAEMRDIVGTLRGGEVALAPAPSVAHLDALLARRAGADARVTVAGDPHALPASVELSAYRVVEHLLGVLADDPRTPVQVRMRFEDHALQITMTGRVARGADLRAAVDRARERVRLQRGTLSVRTNRGRTRVVALMPVAG